MIILRESYTPNWLAPRVAFDVAIERIAEQSILQQERVPLGAGWYWYRPTNALLRPAHWAMTEVEHVKGWHPMLGAFVLPASDRWALAFTRLHF